MLLHNNIIRAMSPTKTEWVIGVATWLLWLARTLAASLQQGRRTLCLDLCLFINCLPIGTFELKNRLTKQTVEDAA